MVSGLIARLYEVVAEFEKAFKGRRFTPDGHLVGSIGEVIAVHRYGLELTPHSTQGSDALSDNGRRVEIKATEGTSIAMRSEAEHLIVLQLDRSGGASEIYNGPGDVAWSASGAMQRNGQRPISVSKLQRLMAGVPSDSRLPALSG